MSEILRAIMILKDKIVDRIKWQKRVLCRIRIIVFDPNICGDSSFHSATSKRTVI